ncbi:hypothetical protein AX16_008734 [Volvariella volvacea WC 439]|nr:hypothetical protein AX16_008734 [Volvariella volvacea WC 439]
MSQPQKTPSFITPDLTGWFKSRFTALVQAPDHDSFSEAFDSLFAQEEYMTGINCNGVNLTREEYKQHLATDLAVGGKVGAEVGWEKIVEAPFGDAMHKEWVDKAKKEQKIKGGAIEGSVGAFFTVTVSRKIRIRVGPMQSHITGSMNAQIISIGEPGSVTGGEHLSGENLRVNLVNQTTQIKPAGIHISPIPGQSP